MPKKKYNITFSFFDYFLNFGERMSNEYYAGIDVGTSHIIISDNS